MINNSTETSQRNSVTVSPKSTRKSRPSLGSHTNDQSTAFQFDKGEAKSDKRASVFDSEDDDESWNLSCWQKFRLFLKQTCKDVCRHKCQFCLSFCSVFVVVLSILIVVSITQKGPTIFLRLSEKMTGEYDAQFYNREVKTFSSSGDDDDYASAYLNYT